MKLNKYIYKQLTKNDINLKVEGAEAGASINEEDIGDWISAWYKDTYARTPPMWLSSKGWLKREKERVARKKGEE
jgi:hypothetical protein|tara:strand:+ start:403 stop:627 length:225 start_codon:yes stop_codon:yes gene_type:complete